MQEQKQAGAKGTYLEHLTSTLAIRRSDEWRVHIQEAVLLEEVVGCVGELVADTGDGANDVGAWPQVRLLPEEFHPVLLLRHGICGAVA